MKTFKKYLIIFLFGALGYGLIEIIWRQRTHPTMLIAGGICFLIFTIITEKFRNIPILYRCILAAFGVTVIELMFGIIFNIGFGMKIWDYSRIPLNFLGQICLLYSVLWGFLALIFLPVADILNNRLKKYLKMV